MPSAAAWLLGAGHQEHTEGSCPGTEVQETGVNMNSAKTTLILKVKDRFHNSSAIFYQNCYQMLIGRSKRKLLCRKN